MTLPFILDVGLGLLFIYLILSLLAAEVQELIATVLQWRAQHLRRAIELLLAGELPTGSQRDRPLREAKTLATQVFHHPLLRGLNQEARGLVGALGRLVSQTTRTSRSFDGDTSGPSYIPGRVFAEALLSTLDLELVVQVMGQAHLERFVNDVVFNPVYEIVSDLRYGVAQDFLLERELQHLHTGLSRILMAFQNRELSFALAQQQSVTELQRFMTLASAALPNHEALNEIFLRRLNALEQEVATLATETGPTVTAMTATLRQLAWVARLLKKHGSLAAVLSALSQPEHRDRFQQGFTLLRQIETLAANQVANGAERPATTDYRTVLATVPLNVLESLHALALQANLKVVNLQTGIAQLQKELAAWFDDSMVRAAGVYKRNAKGVAIIIGFVLAIATNTDTLLVIHRLARDPMLRATYSQAAEQLIQRQPAAIACLENAADRETREQCLAQGGIQADAVELRTAIDQTAELPLGWGETNLRQQWSDQRPGWLNGVLIFIGWLGTAIAISMGAPFWFSLINKVVNLRNSGNQPPTTSA